MTIGHFTIKQSAAIAALAWVVAQVVAFVPSIAQYQSTLISAGGLVIAAVFMLANGLHAHANRPVATPPRTSSLATLRAQLREAGMEPIA